MQNKLQRKIAILKRLEEIGEWQVDLQKTNLEQARIEALEKELHFDKLHSQLREGDEFIRENYRTGFGGIGAFLDAIAIFQTGLESKSLEAQHIFDKARQRELSVIEELRQSDALNKAYERLNSRSVKKLRQLVTSRESAALDDNWSNRRGKNRCN